MYLYSNVSANLLFVKTTYEPSFIEITDKAGTAIACPVFSTVKKGDEWLTTLDAANLETWHPDHPTLYTLRTCSETQRFGHTSLTTFQNKQILLNDSPLYVRGYIRGITAHDHPNMTGLSDYEAALKNIRQAKKYGFNYVRFHSTIPSEDFMRAANEQGILVHIEIDFAFARKKGSDETDVYVNEELWRSTILRYRNHPSLAVFCVGNELQITSRYPVLSKMYEIGKALAPHKLILENTGWGEYDRSTADVFVHAAGYFFPYAHHKDMFENGAQERWAFVDGSVYGHPLTDTYESETIRADATRYLAAIKPKLAHEICHYIELPDYEAMVNKFNAFAEKVGEDYLVEHGIKRRPYFTELPDLIRRKGLTDYIPDYARASRRFKEMAIKVTIERLRFSDYCGFQMLQLSDCFKYENKNGLLDFFDDDIGYDAEKIRYFNADLVLLAEFEAPYCYQNEPFEIELYASDFLPKPECVGTLNVKLDDQVIFSGENFILAGGLQKLITLKTYVKSVGAKKLEVQFISDDITVSNEWDIWVFSKDVSKKLPQIDVEQPTLCDHLKKGTEASELYVTDALTETLLEKLDQGATAILFYEHLAQRNTWQLQGAMERFKPCFWDRGNNLGGIIKHPAIANGVGSELFDVNMQPLLERGSKVNLDDFPCAVAEHILGVDKPVRDRMKTMLDIEKNFIDQDTLRKFSHLFSMKLGNGQLIVCTFNLENTDNPVVSNFIKMLLDNAEYLSAETGLSIQEFRDWLIKTNSEGIRTEDTMNHFWEKDEKFVEDQLFWEEVGLYKMLIDNMEKTSQNEIINVE